MEVAMRLSELLFETRRAVSGDVELASHQLILRAGLARQVASGIYMLTPIAVRALRRLESIVRDEMEDIGGQEVLLPVVNPPELWEASSRYQSVDETLVRFTDRTAHDMVLAMTHEEAATDLVQAFLKSRRQLPLLIFQIQTKFRDELRPRGGLVRLRELMKDAYSFHATPGDLDALYDRVLAAYHRIYARAGVPVLSVASDTGLMGGDEVHEFMLLTPGGEDTLVLCRSCGYAANREVARARVPLPSTLLPCPPQVQQQATPDATTIDDLASRYGYAPDTIVKSVYRLTDEVRVVVALIRGDQEVNELKLARAAGAPLRPLPEDVAFARGLNPGYVGPNPGQPPETFVVADPSVATGGAFVTGSNHSGVHRIGAVWGRDFSADVTDDVALVREGDACIHCAGNLELVRGIEVGNIFKLGTRYSARMGLVVQGTGSDALTPWMGCYGIGITRLLAAVLESNHDQDGIIWPDEAAPWPIHLLTTNTDPAITSAADTVYPTLGPDRVLYDDRPQSPGAKFYDADLLGMPWRITACPRSLDRGGLEVRRRRDGTTRIVRPEDLPAWAAAVLAR
jgi:prolyl-tRNA synthetase